ncbi:methyltransferase domain-containing protein [Nocardia terpenica]|uniref:class I SAM-dependent methyltransferase n=1 Tax=Nocardia terpenica TaxID=455432 RepID=UPI000A947E3B|nr:methyltransferase domain-containing protein [Nocardia terpenica]
MILVTGATGTVGRVVVDLLCAAAPVVQGVAEALPLRADSVDAALAVLTVHHWSDPGRGIAEMKRVARHRLVVLTWDHSVFREFGRRRWCRGWPKRFRCGRIRWMPRSRC